MKYIAGFAAVALLGILSLSGCSHQQNQPAAAPQAASTKVMQKQAATRAQNGAASLDAVRQHMHAGPPS